MHYGSRRPPRPDGGTEGLGLGACDRDLQVYLDRAYRRFGSEALGAYDLPRLDDHRIDVGELRAVAVLWWLYKLEEGGLPSFAEALAKQFAAGRLDVRPDAGGRALDRYRRGAGARHTAEERRAVYSRLFGGPGAVDPNHRFEDLWERLVEALARAAREPLAIGGEAKSDITAAASELCSNLAPRSAGVTRFDADHMLDHVRLALRVLGKPELLAALGARSPMDLIYRRSRLVLGEQRDPRAAVASARAGATVLRWLAERSGDLWQSPLTLEPQDPVLGAAVTLARSM